MKKFKKVLYVIISVVIFAGAIAAALDFMGVINLKTMIRQKMRRCTLNCGISYLRDMLFRKTSRNSYYT